MRVIETILKETATQTEGVAYYGRGPRAFANLDVSQYPRIWIHLVNPMDTVHQNGLIVSEYEIIGEVTGKVEYTADVISSDVAAVEYLATMEALQSIYYRFITNLNRHTNNRRAIGAVTRREVIHAYDDNLAGYMFTMRMAIRETIEYQCP